MLKTLTVTTAKRFRLSPELKALVLSKYPQPKNARKMTFSCSEAEASKLNSGVYQYLIYSTGKEAYLFDASHFQGKVCYVDYYRKTYYGTQARRTFVGRVGALIKSGEYLEKIVL